MPDANGRFKGISVPRLPWVKEGEEPSSVDICLWGAGLVPVPPDDREDEPE